MLWLKFHIVPPLHPATPTVRSLWIRYCRRILTGQKDRDNGQINIFTVDF